MLSGCGREESIEVTGFPEVEKTEETVEPYDQKQEAEKTDPMIVVYVRGAVRKPGVYKLPDGSRVYEAIDAAGGFDSGADREWLNQAELLTDGEMLTVCTLEETLKLKEAGGGQLQETAAGTGASGKTSGAGDPASETSGSGIVNLNSATKDQLMTLPGIGEAKADAIIRYREENGPFSSTEDVMNISGIKDSVYSKIKDRITV